MSNVDTRFGGPRGPKLANGRPPGILIGKDKAKRLRREAAKAAVVRDVVAPLSPSEFIQATWNGAIDYDPNRVALAMKMLPLEARNFDKGPTLESLIAEARAKAPLPPKEQAPQVDTFVEEMLRLSYERFECVMREYAITERQLRWCGDRARANELKHKREDAIAGWNRAAELERAKLVE